MEHDTDKVDQAVLALLFLNLHEVSEFGGRAWKSFDWEAMNRLHERGFIGDPVSKTKSVRVTAEGVKESKRLFQELFGTEAA